MRSGALVHNPQDSTYRVPTKRPPLLAELRTKLASAGDHIRALPEHGDPAEFEAIADALYQAFTTARNLAPSRDSTNCTSHPRGPIDPEAPVGWGQCLLCNTHRRAGNASARAGAPQALIQWDVPPPPYTREGLLDRMQRVNDASFELHLRSSERDFVVMADLLHGAFIIARELSRPRSASGCLRHPGAPTDPAAAGGPRCLFCVADDLRRQRAATPSRIPQPPQARRMGGAGSIPPR
ncbi:hypothetical protein Shyd_93890 [Streptomyces hydrogenans]|uniref:Uncharacterized protein n=1 Tax=Streptomyces hydrogenans TaxID=1873719 RepID=A0ABQ3PCQ8_9ACTN|nr:hypothetical protein GCM10018784_36390 [Streptomyces hydrogenans]GHI22823.1 hypothetical protein Shyd_41940 [Streptomyces hydrogenans]GHI24193.1 hypothetical protein Shyd_55640 [Streptomyces hydrogenans]GHI24246.1 hypothetical protein Shyd_56170 [Streptomyces hydrogenans]GHI24471.1 hypothetical protein Shyd_58420 [Streptomyces hydrogenans]